MHEALLCRKEADFQHQADFWYQPAAVDATFTNLVAHPQCMFSSALRDTGAGEDCTSAFPLQLLDNIRH